MAEHEDVQRQSRELQEARDRGDFNGRGVEYREAENAVARQAAKLVAEGKGPVAETPAQRAAHVEGLKRQIAANEAAIRQARANGD